MNIAGFELWQIIDITILLLIGMGPKIALVPFIDMTADLDSDTRKQVAKKMITTATTWALILVFLGAFLMKLLHFSEEALYIAGGIVFLLIALHMLVGAGGDDKKHDKVTRAKALEMAQYPLAIPYLLNPVGIVMLVIFSTSIDSVSKLALFVGLVLFMALLDWLVFSHLDGLMKHLDKSRLAVTEAIFGVLLSALAVELVLIGLSGLGVIEAVAH